MELAFRIQQGHIVAVAAHSANDCFGQSYNDTAAFTDFQMLVAVHNSGFKPYFCICNRIQLCGSQGQHGQQLNGQNDLACIANLCRNVGQSSLIDFQRCNPGCNGQGLAGCFNLSQSSRGHFHRGHQIADTAEVHSHGVADRCCNGCIDFPIGNDCLVAIDLYCICGNSQHGKQHDQNQQEGNAILHILHLNAFFLTFRSKILR